MGISIQFQGITRVKGDETVHRYVESVANAHYPTLIVPVPDKQDNILLYGRDLAVFARDILDIEVDPEDLEKGNLEDYRNNFKPDNHNGRILIFISRLQGKLKELLADDFRQQVTDWFEKRVTEHNDTDVSGDPIRYVSALMGNFISPKY